MAGTAQVPETAEARINTQHNELHTQIDALNKAIRKRAPRENLMRMIAETRGHLQYHFDTEETLMMDADYPKSRLLAHRAAHVEAIGHLNGMLSHLAHNTVPPMRIFEFLFDWSYVHELNEDRDFSLFLNDHPKES